MKNKSIYFWETTTFERILFLTVIILSCCIMIASAAIGLLLAFNTP